MVRITVRIAGALLAFAALFGSASAGPMLSANGGLVLDRLLTSNVAMRTALGPGFDVLRLQPVAGRSDRFVIDVATADHEKGLRVVADVGHRSIVSIRPLARADIPYTDSDVAAAFAVARGWRLLQAALGAHLADYKVSAPGDTLKPSYRVGGLVVRGAMAADRCAVHRCIQLLFHAPSGYVVTPTALVDLTTQSLIGVPAQGLATTPSAPQPRVHTVRQLASRLNQDCKVFRFDNAPSTWNVCWSWISGPGLVLGPVSFSKDLGGAPFQLIDDARVDQIFVPYASGYPRFYDTDAGYPPLVLPQPVCAPAERYDSNTVCLQRQDRGVDWLYGGQQPTGREGEQFVLWSVLDADNYEYIERWIFRDDGTFGGEVEATGVNLSGAELESHTHDYVWRIVPHLGGAGNSVDHSWLYEPVDGLTSTDVEQNIPMPAGIAWSPQTFDELDVYAPGMVNKRGDQISYRLIPEPVGGLAHHEELFTRDDLWATAGNPTELDAFDLPGYASEKISLVDTSITLWYKGSFHHQPRDEDGYFTSQHAWIGVTHAAPVGFVFQPRNLYDQSPFFSPDQP